MTKAVIRYSARQSRFEDEIRAMRLDSFLVTNQTNVSYLSGFRGHDAVILFAKGKRYFITDSRYIEEAREDIKGFYIELVRESTYGTLGELARAMRLKRTGFESMNLPFGVVERLKEVLHNRSALRPFRGVIEGLRSIKDTAEIELIKRSIQLARGVLVDCIKKVKPGAYEDQLAGFIGQEFNRKGAYLAFDPIVASGAHSSKPHARPRRRRIRPNSSVMIDVGCCLDGYNSDITKTLCVGKPPARFRKIYDIVKRAQALAIERIAPGKRASEVDFAARSYICKKGFGRNFGHSLGHGVGMSVHEEPSISKMSKAVLKTGMVFTVEPAIYIPGFGGIRIEDMVLVTDKGCEILSR
jgi:Xaa-Pro aminopeptidase